MELYLVRHGETEWNKERRLQGQADVALDDFNEFLDFSIIENKIKNGEVISLTRTRKVDERYEFLNREDFDNRGASKGKTLYFGNRGSEFLLRLYD